MAKRTTSSKSKKSSRNVAAKATVMQAPVEMPVAVESPVLPVGVEASVAVPTREQIARRAFEIFLRRGGGHGRHLEDWLEAERELGCRAA